MERVFGLQKGITKIIFLFTALFMFGMLWKIFLQESGETHYQITSPNGDYHLTTYILEKNGCIIFVDELGIENRICGSYSVKKL
jgi:hypothetical protein